MKNIQPDQWLAEITKADARLREFLNSNRKPEPLKPRAAAMRWALDFARRNLDDLSEGDLANRQRELTCFARFQMEEPVPSAITVSYGPWPTRQEILSTQQWLRATLEAIRARQTFGLTEPERQWGVVYSTGEGRWKELYTYNIIVGPGVIELFTLLREQVNALRECKAEDCRQLFLQDRSNQNYCCRRHQWKHVQREHKGIPSERHGKLGPRPKPTTRPTPSPQKTGGRHAAKTRTR